MAYTPELSLESSQILRRIAWALEKPMTEAIEIVIINMTRFVDPEKICKKCKDNSLCSDCIFSPQNHKVCNKILQ